MDKERFELLEVTTKNDGWYWVTLYQYDKEWPEHPDYFQEWLECIDGKWDYHYYGDRCLVYFIHKREE